MSRCPSTFGVTVHLSGIAISTLPRSRMTIRSLMTDDCGLALSDPGRPHPTPLPPLLRSPHTKWTKALSRELFQGWDGREALGTWASACCAHVDGAPVPRGVSGA